MTRVFRTFAILASALLASACTKPYAPPEWHVANAPEALEFPGIRQLLDRDKPLRLFWIHGMCPHTAEWAIERAKILASALSAIEPRMGPILKAAAGHEIVTAEIDAPGGRILAHWLIWSPLIDTYRDSLNYDSSPHYGPSLDKRASLNATLKSTIMNQCLVDAVVYSGAGRAMIQGAVRESVCQALGGNLNPASGCTFGADDGASIALVSESLGSKLLADAVRDIWKRNADGPSAAFAARLGRVGALYLVSNQIPLLDAADPPRASVASGPGELPEGLPGLIEAIQRGKPARPAGGVSVDSLPPLHVVAFTDPNDLLSYRLETRHIGSDSTPLANALVSNANTYFGLVARPDYVHCGYKWNPYVIGVLVNGHATGREWTKVAGGTEGECF